MKETNSPRFIDPLYGSRVDETDEAFFPFTPAKPKSLSPFLCPRGPPAGQFQQDSSSYVFSIVLCVFAISSSSLLVLLPKTVSLDLPPALDSQLCLLSGFASASLIYHLIASGKQHRRLVIGKFPLSALPPPPESPSPLAAVI